MPATLNLEPALSFLDELRQNNNKAWFDSHRPAYEAACSAFERLINDVIDEFRASDNLQGLAAKNCIARINRDVRFSKDKSPYKTNLGAMIAPGGWKTSAFGYYVSVEPYGQSMVAGGLYVPTSEQLSKFRQAIDRDATEFKQLTQAKDFVGLFGAVEGERLKTAPKGYDRAHPESVLLQLKQIFVMRHFSDQEVLAPAFTGQVIVASRSMRPFLDYLAGIMQ